MVFYNGKGDMAIYRISLCGRASCPHTKGKFCRHCELMRVALDKARLSRLLRMQKEGNRFAGLAAQHYLKKVKEVYRGYYYQRHRSS